MSDNQIYIGIKNWAKYQITVKSGCPEYIKDYVDKEQDREYSLLREHQKSIYDSLRRKRGKLGKNLPLDVYYLINLLGIHEEDRRYFSGALERIVELGLAFLTYAEHGEDDRIPADLITHDLFLKGAQPSHFKAANEQKRQRSISGKSAQIQPCIQRTVSPTVSPVSAPVSAHIQSCTDPISATECTRVSARSSVKERKEKESSTKDSTTTPSPKSGKQSSVRPGNNALDFLPDWKAKNGNGHSPVLTEPVAPISKTFDLLNFCEDVGDIPGDEVHRVIFYWWMVEKDDYWRSRLKTREDVSRALKELQRQTPKDFVIPGWATQPRRKPDPACPLCNGTGTTVIQHQGYTTFMMAAQDCDCVKYEVPVITMNSRPFNPSTGAQHG